MWLDVKYQTRGQQACHHLEKDIKKKREQNYDIHFTLIKEKPQ